MTVEIEGDYIFNNCYRIIRENDHSEEAHATRIECFNLIQEEKRWPDYMNEHPSVVKTWTARIINRTINKIAGEYLLPYRYQGRMVRDIYVSFTPVALMHGSHDLLQEITPSWYVYSPSFWAWWNYVKTRDVKYLKIYRAIRSITPESNKDYVIRLNEIRELAIQMI